ncbi:hypothetical protein Lade_0752 [Legionella adelaidensis]|uniref:Thioredoxin domain-containing protein n=1 Tax=Legionella adelaidensis TaxID=45056 RepID=A0A0W0R4Z8_9GAMM|nr:hypothetical protein [Legionella adelaidensis]KTC66094.1 hypothetical protein Lade_0752 [Legionella adelaidensis]
MATIRKYIIHLVLVLLSYTVFAENSKPNWYTETANKQIILHLDFFESSTCPHCLKANDFLKKLESQGLPLQVNRYIVNENKSALEFFHQRLEELNSLNFAVPSFFFCNSRWVGFLDEQRTGQLLLKAMDYCQQQIVKEGKLSDGTVKVLRQWSMANQIQVENKIANSPLRFLVGTALMDAFSACSLFAFFTFLAFLWVAPRKWELEIGYGLLFIVTLGYLHYIEQAHSKFFFQATGWTRIPAVILGVILLSFFSFYLRKRSNEIVKGTRPIIPFLILLTVPFLMIYQQTCEFNVALIFEQWLTSKGIKSTQLFWYYFFYQLIYIFPLLLVLIIHLLLSHYFQMTKHLKLQKFSGAVFLSLLGLIFIIWPYILNNVFASLFAFFIAIALAWILKKIK